MNTESGTSFEAENDTVFVAELEDRKWIASSENEAIDVIIENISNEEELSSFDLMEVNMNGDEWKVGDVEWGDFFLKAVRRLNDGN